MCVLLFWELVTDRERFLENLQQKCKKAATYSNKPWLLILYLGFGLI